MLHELHPQPADLLAAVEESSQALMGVVFRVVHEHEWKSSAGPTAICLFLPDTPELRDEPPVTGPSTSTRFAHHLAALHRHQCVAERYELQGQLGEAQRIATIDDLIFERGLRL